MNCISANSLSVITCSSFLYLPQSCYGSSSHDTFPLTHAHLSTTHI